ncbi:uncharacterized protein LOC125853058 [Solanum stenotomum]|uniref:uncharacterized protein LOC125853058 n=1 Tax=Solanum stenotomum TaxID=172797 RepID=UPI0020D03485|nr:uncharacterized protein LOC125853058 [Solanum stenotomum]
MEISFFPKQSRIILSSYLLSSLFIVASSFLSKIVMFFCLVIYDNVDGEVPYRDLRVAHTESEKRPFTCRGMEEVYRLHLILLIDHLHLLPWDQRALDMNHFCMVILHNISDQL